MKSILLVCLIAFSSAVVCIAQVEKQRGVSVQMAMANSAQAAPEADDSDAWIVTVTADGSLFFGTDRITRKELESWMITHPRKREQQLYIKADARTRYADVMKAVESAPPAGIDAAILLTGQLDSSQPGTILPPKGLEVLVGDRLPAGTVATVVQLFNAGQQPFLLKINNDAIELPALQSTLRGHFGKGDDKIILLKADARLPLTDVVQVLDACHAAGARTYLASPVQ
jgi:biopolymer transport protein ExbD